jgi:predicted metal-binding protein
MPASAEQACAPLFLECKGLEVDLSRQTQSETAADAARVVVFVCETCRSADQAPDAPRAGAALAETTRKLGDAEIEVRAVACLANCKRSLSASIQSADGWSYVFGDLTADSAEDIVTGARLLAHSADGLMPWKGRPDSLKRGMIARIPPLAHQRTDNQTS